MALDRADVQHIAVLARIALTEGFIIVTLLGCFASYRILIYA